MPQGLEPEMLSFLFRISEPFSLHKFILSFWNPCTFLAHTTSTARTPVVQLHGNAKNCCLLLKSANCFPHLVFLVLLLERPALSQYLFFLFSSICLMNTFRSTSLYRDSYTPLMIPLHHENLVFLSTTYFLCIKQLSSHKDFDPETQALFVKPHYLLRLDNKNSEKKCFQRRTKCSKDVRWCLCVISLCTS